MDPGVFRCCTSFSSRAMRHRARARVGGNCDGQCSLQHSHVESHVCVSCMGMSEAAPVLEPPVLQEK
eukprot:7570565-Pyramimonas_sp.AAC.1